MSKPESQPNCGPSHCSTVSGVVDRWMRGEIDYPGVSYVDWAIGQHLRQFVLHQSNGMDVLASSELDNIERIVAAVRKHFSL